jgi:small subunit ribosomal protein S8
MSQTDPIADFLTRIRNACRAKQKRFTVPSTGVRKEIARVLLENNFIRAYTEIPACPQPKLLIRLRYTPAQESYITNIRRLSRPGLRKYVERDELRLGRRQMGMLIISTSRGVMSDKEAIAQGIGGEAICRVW